MRGRWRFLRSRRALRRLPRRRGAAGRGAVVTTLLAVLLALAVGWTWGHATARIRRVPIGAAPEQDDAAIRAEFARFNATLAALDFPTPPDPKDQP